MKGLFILTIIVFSWIIAFVLGEYSTVFGEIWGMAMVQPFVLIFLSIVFYALYSGFSRLFNKKAKEPQLEILIEKENSNASCDSSDIYLKKSISTNDLIEYQIINKNNSLLWRGKCSLNQGSLHSITLYSGDTNKELVFQVTKESSGLEYRLNNGQSTIGSIVITNNGLIFNNIDNNPIYTATLETEADNGFGVVIDWLVALDTLNQFSSASRVNYFTLKDESAEMLGKYYITLKNIDLTTDINNKFDRRIAAIFSMFLDSALIGNLGR